LDPLEWDWPGHGLLETTRAQAHAWVLMGAVAGSENNIIIIINMLMPVKQTSFTYLSGTDGLVCCAEVEQKIECMAYHRACP
jgi:hypothetical protein